MSKKKPISPVGSNTALGIAQFLEKANELPQRISSASKQPGRLIFALDATASRQPGWDRACQLQGQMFEAARDLGGLQVQLCYYRGFNEFHYSQWVNDTRSLLKIMSSVQCLGGYTQIARVLNHCMAIQKRGEPPVKAAIIIADAIEESVDMLCDKAGQLGLIGTPLFMFQEGNDQGVKQCFMQMANLSNGAYATFDETSASQLAELLSAVATYASGGYDALQKLQSNAAKHLLDQLTY